MRTLVLTLVILAVVAVAAVGQSTTTGQSYNGWPEAWRSTYATGFAHGFQSGGAAQRQGMYDWANSCLTKWTVGQFRAIIDQYVRDHPAEWHEGMALLTQRALIAACK